MSGAVALEIYQLDEFTMKRLMKYLPLVLTLIILSVVAVIPEQASASNGNYVADPALYSTLNLPGQSGGIGRT